MVINDSDYEAVNIKLAYLYVNGNTLFGDKDKKKKIEMGAIPHGSYKKVTLTYSDPILTTCTSLAVIEYYINGVKYGGDEFDADYPAETLRDGGNFVFIIKNDRYETS
jgi:hypothetical protein